MGNVTSFMQLFPLVFLLSLVQKSVWLIGHYNWDCGLKYECMLCDFPCVCIDEQLSYVSMGLKCLFDVHLKAHTLCHHLFCVLCMYVMLESVLRSCVCICVSSMTSTCRGLSWRCSTLLIASRDIDRPSAGSLQQRRHAGWDFDMTYCASQHKP